MVAAGGMTAAAGLTLALLSALPIGLLVAALGLMLALVL